jgi:hypothetical protein
MINTQEDWLSHNKKCSSPCEHTLSRCNECFAKDGCNCENIEAEDWKKDITPLLQRTWDNKAGYYDWVAFITQLLAKERAKLLEEIEGKVEWMKRMESDYDDDDKRARRDVSPYNQALSDSLSIVREVLRDNKDEK